MSETYPVQGAGLGLRRAFIGSLADDIPSQIDFMEVAPETVTDCLSILVVQHPWMSHL